ncbi:MAG: chemotaxis-specific protein-glutamate methyltransferase CheB [Armatimonadota bacterium]
MVRVLLAEDSLVVREHLVSLLSEDPEIQLVGTARNGVEAVEMVRQLRPDVVLMDVTMPRMGGYEATRQIMGSSPLPIVMISSGFDTGGVATTFEALRAGAVAVVEKPRGGGDTEEASARELCQTVKLMAEVKVVRRWARDPSVPRPISPADRPRAGERPVSTRTAVAPSRQRRIELAVIGASTGGPAVLVEILTRQPAQLPVPILIVQHIARGFVGGLAAWLNEQTALNVKLAEPYEPLRAGVVYLAPDGYQLGVTPTRRIRLVDAPAEDGFKPSISYTLRSVAAQYGAAGLGVLLTGMGHDGAAGLLQLRQAGGLTVAQDAASSVIFGMAERAVGLGAVEHVSSPREIAELLRTLPVPGEENRKG